MDEIKIMIEEKIKQLLKDVTEDSEMSFECENDYFNLILNYIDLWKGIGEENGSK